MNKKIEFDLAKARFLGYFMTARHPVMIDIPAIAKRLELDQVLLTQVVEQLRIENRIDYQLVRVLAHDVVVPPADEGAED